VGGYSVFCSLLVLMILFEPESYGEPWNVHAGERWCSFLLM
jgi:hypothetical protein